MTYDHELILIGITMGENDIGDPIKITARRNVLCALQSVTRSEHYQAAAQGVKPSIVFLLNRYEYQGEAKVEFEGKTYNVIRTYSPNKGKGLGDFETLELVCEGVE